MTAIEKNEAAAQNPFDGLNLIALRKYACADTAKRKNEWYLECIGCEKFWCNVGKRARDILDTDTKPEKTQTEKFDERMMKTKSKHDEVFREALTKDDPIGYIKEKAGYSSRASAVSCFREWKKKNGIHVDSAAEAQSKIRDRLKLEALKRIDEIFDGYGPEEAEIRYLENCPDGDSTLMSAATRLYGWLKKYPDIKEKYPFMRELSRKYTTNSLRHLKISEHLAKIKKEEKPVNIPEQTDDEMSLTDFLDEVAPATKSEPAVDIRPVVVSSESNEEEPEEPKPLVVDLEDPILQQKLNEMDILQRQFSRKRAEINQGIEKLNGTIREAQQAVEKLEKKRQALDEAALIFGMVPKNKEVTA